MIPLFVGYAMLIWFMTGRLRRRALGACVVLGGLLGLVLLNWLHIKLGDWTEGEIYVPVLQTITYPYTALVFAVGVFIWSIPTNTDSRCGMCKYDLSGLGPVRGVIICPECGGRNATREAYRKSGTDRVSYATDDDHPAAVPGIPASSPGEAPGASDQEDAQRHAADQRPAEQREGAV